MRLKGKVAIITGGNSGIGQATAILFAREGARVVIAARDSGSGHQTVDMIKAFGGEAVFIQTDVSKELEVRSLIMQVIVKFKRIDILFNNAGIELTKPVTETTEEELQRILDVNLKGVFFGCKYAIPYMLKNKSGSIINTASSAGVVGMPNLAAYSASKGAVISLTRQTAVEYAEQGIRVNAICPGAIMTPMLRRYIDMAPNPLAAEEKMAEVHPMKRVGKPEEIANAALFLASDESSFMTGQALCVDGGLTSA
jgi:NAD(P)-dependent dehydrogenase (short-subunit alcohol dehydrogenase family)